jgi:hypothetical protein
LGINSPIINEYAKINNIGKKSLRNTFFIIHRGERYAKRERKREKRVTDWKKKQAEMIKTKKGLHLKVQPHILKFYDFRTIYLE